MFRQIAASFVMAAATMLSAAPAFATDFLRAIEDVPLPAGLTEQAEPVVFESDQGRVVQTVAAGDIRTSDIADFYRASLPSLGWKPVASDTALSFERENEHLNITMREPASAAPITVKFELIVKLASTRLAD